MNSKPPNTDEAPTADESVLTEVARQMAVGLTTEDTAEALGVSVATVEQWRRSPFVKDLFLTRGSRWRRDERRKQNAVSRLRLKWTVKRTPIAEQRRAQDEVNRRNEEVIRKFNAEQKAERRSGKQQAPRVPRAARPPKPAAAESNQVALPPIVVGPRSMPAEVTAADRRRALEEQAEKLEALWRKHFGNEPMPRPTLKQLGAMDEIVSESGSVGEP